ncbi:MAG: UDP-glucose--hexose-1-phosphate uridylyltransferase [Coprobacillus sp.]|nr:UDP-glucose--hexose-1-phosphate uridylyltransferase [Coprobacillus sp.]
MMIDDSICKLIAYGLKTELITKDDVDYCVNRYLEILKLDSIDGVDSIPTLEVDIDSLPDTLAEITNFAIEKKIVKNDTTTERDLFDTKLMDVLTPRPHEVIAKFNELYAKSPKEATDWYYKFSQDTNYIRRNRIKSDLKWTYKSKYGDLDITINLSKPEKDPKEIAAARDAEATGYPKCQLCKENVGYKGSLSQQARNNHRIIPLDFNGKQWYLQYSPYVYYNEHCIAFNEEHVPMVINEGTFDNLVTFLDYFPHYTIGSNADLPIVGGSILSHEHYQGGCYEFPLQRAEAEKKVKLKGFGKVDAMTVKWPMSVIRLVSKNKDQLKKASLFILDKWRDYTDEDAYIYAYTDGVNHNTITPIAWKHGKKYVMDLVLRNNITTDEHPLGLYHPHEELHHIKKENIGLIEVMGLAILPARLKKELDEVGKDLLKGKDLYADPVTEKHADWANDIKARRELTKDNIDDVLQEEVGKVFEQVLTDAGVFKRDKEGKKAFKRFLETLKKKEKLTREEKKQLKANKKQAKLDKKQAKKDAKLAKKQPKLDKKQAKIDAKQAKADSKQTKADAKQAKKDAKQEAKKNKKSKGETKE